MSKAEEKAMRYCCQKCPNDKFNCGIKLSSHGRDCVECSSFVKGYHQAEKDLELTWEDIEKIDNITIRLDASLELRGMSMSNQEFYQEVLKRFKEMKEHPKNEEEKKETPY